MADMESQLIGPVLGALGALATVALTFSRLKAAFRKEIDEEIKRAVDQARNMAESDIKSFNLKIDAVSKDIGNLENKIDRDIEHVKTIYNSEIRSLADKIESLRDQVQDQHHQLVSLLSKLVSDR